MRTTNEDARAPQGDEVVLMYPGNELKAQVREYSETHSVFAVLKETFFPEK